jgi:hypothetical protein
MTVPNPIAIAANATLQAAGHPHPHRPLSRVGKIIWQTLYRLTQWQMGSEILQSFSIMTSSKTSNAHHSISQLLIAIQTQTPSNASLQLTRQDYTLFHNTCIAAGPRHRDVCKVRQL